ncbi:hypothetical protein RDV89_04395 [Nocardioides zeae]|uniref:Lipoprotein n=1 Tax=Nocardioides imazamoxiresistens TaxID=3231893 RepID=A0ABU3PSS9_9ACTN|nr:hypothetical protein [Nocardioides zeae]MDT9592291.1 hypothetical protein [Nocardioides zeae]
MSHRPLVPLVPLPRPGRRLHGTLVALVVLGLVVGCTAGGGGDGDESDASAVEEYDARVAEVDEVVRAVVGAALEELGGSARGGGTGAHQLCGDGPRYTGAEYRASVDLSSLRAGGARTVEVLTGAFEAEGWTVEPGPTGLEADKDPLGADLSSGAGGRQLVVRSGCVDTSHDTAVEIADRPAVDLGL